MEKARAFAPALAASSSENLRETVENAQDQLGHGYLPSRGQCWRVSRQAGAIVKAVTIQPKLAQLRA
jgi:hypothetical protein